MSSSSFDSDRLNQASAHDTGIYDAGVHDNQIVAMYDTDAQARSAHDALVQAGVPADAMQVAAKGSETGTLGGVNAEDRDEGVWGAIRNLFAPEDDRTAYSHAVGRGHALLIVTPRGGMGRSNIVRILESTEPVDFDARLEEWRQSGYDTTTTHPDYRATTATGFSQADASSTGSMAAGSMAAGSMGASTGTSAVGLSSSGGVAPMRGDEMTDTLKAVREELRVGKRVVESGAARIRSYVVERPVEEQISLREEHVRVDRVPVDRPATAADLAAFQERTIEARATSEEAVVSKEARVTEEVGLHKDATERTETIRDTVRETKIEVEDGMDVAATKGAGTSGANAPRR